MPSYRLRGIAVLFALLVLDCIAPTRLLAQDAPLPPDEAARSMTVPDGFKVTLFAGEPDVVQPIAMTFDDRGRLWVVECMSYPDWEKRDAAAEEAAAGAIARDRVVIFDDRDHDGRFDERKVFWDQGENLSGIELGFGGVWLCSTPNLIFVPDADADDVPDGPPETRLDGWDIKAKHNAFNGLNWGPDGWLYGCNGILSNSKVGPPGTADADRVAINCGVWRYHPTQKRFEAVAHGTTNPWGVDFDDYGAMFITNCVIKHAFHIVPGGRYTRMFGQDLNPYAFGLMESCADHIHWAGGFWDTEGTDKPINDAFGGGHAHCGTMVYLGDNWPAKYRNALMTCNIHGRRVNSDRLEHEGSGYVAKHGDDVIKSADPWFRGVALCYGPDGGVYLADWSDTGECHDYDDVHRENGRIFKITHGDVQPATADIEALDDARLVELQAHANDWHVRHARRVLHERAAAGMLSPQAGPALLELFQAKVDTTRRLRALWALYVIGGWDEALLEKALQDEDEHVRGWAVRLALDDAQPSPATLERLDEMAQTDASPSVRLELASAMLRLPVERRGGLALELVRRAEDSNDENLPLLLWYAIEPLIAKDTRRARVLLSVSAMPLLRNHIARRLALAGKLDAVVQGLGVLPDPAAQLDVLDGVEAALQGQRRAPMPKGWKQTAALLAKSPQAKIRERVMALSVVFGDTQAEAAMRDLVADKAAPAAERASALAVLVQQRSAGLAPVLQKLLADAALRGTALRGLAAYDDPATPKRIMDRYSAFSEAERADAVSTLASRPVYALALLAAVEEGTVARQDISPFIARQLVGLDDAEVTARLEKAWGTIRPASETKGPLLARYKALLTDEYTQTADLAQGRQIFQRHCASCHVLFGEGGRIGPELTGAQRSNLDYVLENLADPSAVVPRDYQVTLVQTTDGRVISGIVRDENELSLTVQTATEAVMLPKDEIEAREQTPQSMMPEGVLAALKDEEVRDLAAYLASPQQVALPKE